MIVPKNCCGWVALLRALIHNKAVRDNWQGSLDWLKFDPKDPSETFRKKKHMNLLVMNLKNHLGIQENVWDLTPLERLST